MPHTKGRKPARGSQSQKMRPSSDRRLQLAFVKLESLVIAGQQHCGECVPEPCTHRPSSHEREGRPKSLLKAPKTGCTIRSVLCKRANLGYFVSGIYWRWRVIVPGFTGKERPATRFMHWRRRQSSLTWNLIPIA